MWPHIQLLFLSLAIEMKSNFNMDFGQRSSIPRQPLYVCKLLFLCFFFVFCHSIYFANWIPQKTKQRMLFIIHWLVCKYACTKNIPIDKTPSVYLLVTMSHGNQFQMIVWSFWKDMINSASPQMNGGTATTMIAKMNEEEEGGKKSFRWFGIATEKDKKKINKTNQQRWPQSESVCFLIRFVWYITRCSTG